MAKVIRCPACGALWRLPDGEAAQKLRCGQCGAVFQADRAESALVPDAALDALAAKAEREALAAAAGAAGRAEPSIGSLRGAAPAYAPGDASPAASAAAGEAAMTKIAADMQGFSSPDALNIPYEPNRGSAIKAWIAGILGAAAVAAAAAGALLYWHEPVLEAAPALRVLYERVCGMAPCPGFVWAEPSAFAFRAQLAPIEGTDARHPAVDVEIRNTSAHPQRLPIIEMKLLDPAGDTIAQRILEPAEYGFPQKPAVLPAGESVRTVVRVQTALPYDAASAAVAAVDAQ